MVAILQSTPRQVNGEIDRRAWFNLLSIRYPKEKLTALANHFNQASAPSLEVANILLEIHADLDAILAALLMDQSIKKRTENLQNLPSIVGILLKNIDDLNHVGTMLFQQKNLNKVEGVRQMMLAMVKDVRVVLVKLAERTYAARQLKNLSSPEQAKLAYELIELYAPLANRLGIGALKWEMEDRALAVLEPVAYQQITAALKTRRTEREIFIQNFIEILERLLQQTHIRAEYSGRVKHIYSIWRKMQKKQLRFQELYDVRAIRILVKDVPSCYTVMALLQDYWPSLVTEYTDYIINPKPNGYRSLHIVLLGEDDLPIEIQIRTFGMHEQAESGVAAHWRYKEGNQAEDGIRARVEWLRALLDWQQEVSEAEADTTILPSTLAANDKYPVRAMETLYVFTKDNEVIPLKQGATPVDFAFRLHTQLGLCIKGAFVNKKIVPLNYSLRMGDQIEILLHKEPNPSRDWLLPSQAYIHTATARRKLRNYFRERDNALTKPSELKPSASVHPTENLPSKTFLSESTRTSTVPTSPGIKKLRIAADDLFNLPYQTAGCCNPDSHGPIIASITRARGLVIHKLDCKNINYFKIMRPDRLLDVQWRED